MVRSHLKPRLIFYRAVDILIEQKVALPSSDALSRLILDVLNHRRRELVAAIDQNLSGETREVLDRLLEKATNENDEPSNRFQLTLLKRCSQSTRPGKIRQSVDDLKLIRGLQEYSSNSSSSDSSIELPRFPSEANTGALGDLARLQYQGLPIEPIVWLPRSYVPPLAPIYSVPVPVENGRRIPGVRVTSTGGLLNGIAEFSPETDGLVRLWVDGEKLGEVPTDSPVDLVALAGGPVESLVITGIDNDQGLNVRLSIQCCRRLPGKRVEHRKGT